MRSMGEMLRSGMVRQAMTAAVGASARASSQIVTVVVTLFAARQLAPTAFGTFAIASAWVTLVRTIFYGGAYEYLLKAPDARKASSECLATNLAVGLILTVPLLLFVPFSSAVFKSAVVGHLLLALAPSNLVAAFGAWQEALVLRRDRLRAYYAVFSASEILSGVVAVVMLAMGSGIEALVVQVYARAVVCLVGFLLLGATVLSERFSKARFDEIMHWSLTRHFSVFLGFGTTYAADIILGFTLSPAAAGLYRASNRIVTAVSDVITQPARMMALSAFSRLAADGRTAERQWASFSAVAAVVGWSALGGLAVIGPVLVPTILGDAWRPASSLVPVLCAARALSLLDTLSGTMLVTYDRQKLVFRMQIVIAVAMLVALLVTARYGVGAATWGILATAVFSSSLQFLMGWRHFPGAAAEFRRHAAVALAPVASTVVGAGLVLRMMGGAWHPAVVIALVVIAGAAAWGLAILAMRHPFRRVIAGLRPDRAPLAV